MLVRLTKIIKFSYSKPRWIRIFAKTG